jgi:hypothetical protein
MADKLTVEMIAEAMARAEMIACSPGDHRCYPLSHLLEDAHASCTPKGRRRIEGTRRAIVANRGRDRWDVWLDRHTGEGRLRRQCD